MPPRWTDPVNGQVGCKGEMKFFGILVLAAAVFTVRAGEREALREAFENENAAAQTEFQEAETTVSMTESAGNLCSVADSPQRKT